MLTVSLDKSLAPIVKRKFKNDGLNQTVLWLRDKCSTREFEPSFSITELMVLKIVLCDYFIGQTPFITISLDES